MQGWSLAEVAAPAPRPATPPQGHRQQWLLEALDRLGALRRLGLASCHLRPHALHLVASHSPRLQVAPRPPPPRFARLPHPPHRALSHLAPPLDLHDLGGSLTDGRADLRAELILEPQTAQ